MKWTIKNEEIIRELIETQSKKSISYLEVKYNLPLETSRDIFREAISKIYTCLVNDIEISHPKAYLWSIVINLANREIKQEKKKSTYLAHITNNSREILIEESTPYCSIIDEGYIHAVFSSMKDSRCKTILMGYFAYEYKLKDIGEDLKIKADNARKLKERCLKSFINCAKKIAKELG